MSMTTLMMIHGVTMQTGALCRAAQAVGDRDEHEPSAARARGERCADGKMASRVQSLEHHDGEIAPASSQPRAGI